MFVLALLGCQLRSTTRTLIAGRSSSSKGDGIDKDQQLELHSSQLWREHNYRVWDVIEELVQLNTHPAPANPFELDFEALLQLSHAEQTLLSGALVQFLTDLIRSKPRIYAHLRTQPHSYT